MSQFFTNIKALWDEIDAIDPIALCECAKCTCTVTQKMLKSQQDQRLMTFLMKLNDDYAQARTNILMMQPLPNMAIAYRLCMQEEKHKEVSSLTSTTAEHLVFCC